MQFPLRCAVPLVWPRQAASSPRFSHSSEHALDSGILTYTPPSAPIVCLVFSRRPFPTPIPNSGFSPRQKPPNRFHARGIAGSQSLQNPKLSIQNCNTTGAKEHKLKPSCYGYVESSIYLLFCRKFADPPRVKIWGGHSMSHPPRCPLTR